MLTRAAIFALAWAFVFGIAVDAATKNSGPYTNFELPRAPMPGPKGQGKLHVSSRLKLKNTVRSRTPGVDAKQFVFAKEAFLEEKREEAIKLLRQQMDSGLKGNRENMLLRLGQLYAEKYMELSLRETEVLTAKLEAHQKSGAKGPAPKPDTRRSKRYLKDALKLFYELERNYPKHPRLDEVLFFIGFVEMEGGSVAKGARYLERMVREFPRSRKYEDAVVYLGDYYFDRSRFKDALAKYSVLVRNRESPIYHYAVYKKAWCDLNLRNGALALSQMKRLVNELDGSKEPAKFNLREQAIRDLVTFYAEAGNIDEAMDFFTSVVGKEKAVQNLRLIADSMRAKARDAEAIRAYQRLMKETPDNPEAPLIALGIYESLHRMDKTDQAVESLVVVLDKYGPNSDWARNFRGENQEKVSMLKAVETEGSKAAFFYHASAQKGANKSLYNHALRLYDGLLQNFPEHPERKKLLFYRGEVLYGQKKWIEAADSYMLASKIEPKDKLTDEAVYNALLSLDQLTAKVEKIERFSEKEQKNMDLTPREIPKGERRFIEIAEFYMQEYPRGARIVDVRFRIAAVYYRYRHFDKALPLFQTIATQHPKHRSATTAAYIVLDVMNIQKDYENLDKQARVFAGTPGLGDKKFKAEMAEISGQIGFKQVEKLEADNKWAQAGESYLKVYKSDPSGALAEKSLYNALVSFEKAEDAVKTQQLTREFLVKYPKSQYAERLSLTAAKSAEKLFDFESAQKLYYDFYRNHPKSKEASKALYNSAVFAEVLEMNKEAVARYEQYLKIGGVGAEEARAVRISMAAAHRRQGNWGAVDRIYRQLGGASGRPTDRLLYMGELARQYELAGRTAQRNQLMREIRAAYDSAGRPGKGVGFAAFYAAQASYEGLSAQRKKYDETEIRFPVQDLVYLVGLKQRRLKNLGTAYDKVIETGVPEWGVAALHDKAQAFEDYGKTFRKVVIPKNLKGDDLKEAQEGLKKIEADIVVELDKRARELFKSCAEKALEFHVATESAAKCRLQAKLEGYHQPQGLTPSPGAVARAWRKWEGKPPSADDTEKTLVFLANQAETGAIPDTLKRLSSFAASVPGDSRPVYLLGLLYRRAGKLAMADYLLGQVEKDDKFAWKSLLLNDQGLQALRESNRTLALDLFEKAGGAAPKLAAPNENLGALYLQSGSFAKAERSFRAALEGNGDSEVGRLGLGVALEGQGKFEAAHAAYEAAPSDHLMALYNNALLLGNQLGRKQDAASRMQKYLERGGKESARARDSLKQWQ